MPSAYLTGADLATYGVPAATPQQITSASALIDGYLKRPEGLVWAPDALGNPTYMVGKTAMGTFTASAPIAAGLNVIVPVTGVPIGNALLNEVVVIDQADSTKVEACAIVGVDPVGGTITLGKVVGPHLSGAKLDLGLAIREERELPNGRSIARVASGPVVRLISGQGRYGYGRRSDQIEGMYGEFNLLATVQSFGGPPLWSTFPADQASVSPTTNEIWIPAGILLAYFSEVTVWYLAGWSYAALPSTIKQACANIIGASQPGDLTGNIRRVQQGAISVERFADTVLDADTKSMLDPFRARLLF